MLRTSPRSLDDSRSKRILNWKRWVPEESLWNWIDGLPDDWANSSSLVVDRDELSSGFESIFMMDFTMDFIDGFEGFHVWMVVGRI
jgi:hypothetical protein